MDRKIQLYVSASETKRLELFEDEQINVTSTVQNIQDLSKNYTDFSQSFTIPASDYNNAILEHFYQSDVNSSLDYNIRLDAFIEIDLTFFRRGKLQVEKANIKNGRPDSYTVTFYGDGASVKDLIGEDLLSDLDYEAYNHTYSWYDVHQRITDSANTYDVKYPLISSQRIWQYQSTQINATLPDWLSLSGGGNNNIHSGGGAIVFDELCPAFRVSKIFRLMESKYGVTFSGTFLNDKRFTDLFLWYKNANGINKTSKSYPCVINSIASTIINDVDLTSSISVANNSITVTQNQTLPSGFHRIKLNILTVSNGSTYYIDAYQNGNLISSTLASGAGNKYLSYIQNTSGLNDVYTFSIRFLTGTTITHEFVYDFSGTTLNTSGTPEYGAISTANASITSLINLNLAANAPKMKVIDFFSGILKTFNLVCVGVGLNKYELAPLDTWYGQGRIIDVSKHIDVDTIDVQRMPLYKKIGFSFQKSESVLNRQFSQTYNREYGDMMYQYNYDGGEYVTEVPFENLIQQKFTGTNLQVGYCLNNEFAPYVPNAVLLYQYDNLDCDFKLSDGSTSPTVTNYTPFGQDLRYNLQDYTLNFAPETSSLLLQTIQNTLFKEYDFSYLYNLYNLKQRIIMVKANLPVSMLTSLRLNDRLIIRDKRYIINDMKSNLTTGEVNFSLYLDFRPMINVNTPIVPTSGGDVSIAFNIPNGGESIDLSPSDGVTLSSTRLTESEIITATVASSEPGTFHTIDATYIFLDGTTTNDIVSILVLE